MSKIVLNNFAKPQDMERFLNIKELSQHLNVKVWTIYDWVHKGLIPYYKLNKLVRFKKVKLMNGKRKNKSKIKRA